MLKELTRFRDEVSLICNSGIQFLDFGFPEEDPDKALSRYFLERRQQATAESPNPSSEYEVRALDYDEDGEFIDFETRRQITSEAIYPLDFADAARAFDRTWLPVPFLKIRDEADSGPGRFEKGPTTWARIQIVKLDEPDDWGNAYRVLFAFNTTPDEAVEGRPYAAPIWQNVETESAFELASRPDQIYWFTGEDWSTGWLKSWLADLQAREKAEMEARGDPRDGPLPLGDIEREDEQPAAGLHWAYYLLLLEGIAKYCTIPRVKFLDTVSETAGNQPINVDLVLDIGNSRTCGVLIEAKTEPGNELLDSTPLEMRDLSRPWLVYTEPFRSHVEFAEASFGNERWAIRAGRRASVSWPSLLRVGTEALWLNGQSDGADGDTGLSAPKRYIWDDRMSLQPWYFSSAATKGDSAQQVAGKLHNSITSDGRSLSIAREDVMIEKARIDAEHAKALEQYEAEGHGEGSGEEPPQKAPSPPNPSPALEPRFSRASMFSFMLMEIVTQAIRQMNDVALRARRKNPHVRRRLRNVIVTIPSATPLIERDDFEKRGQAGLQMLWSVNDWDTNAVQAARDKDPYARSKEEEALLRRVPEKPELVISYDEASCTQIVYLYAEISQKLRRDPAEFFAQASRDHTGDRVRIASIDIGGGTTDLMIATYGVREGGKAIKVAQNFREGFRCAGDDILEAVISQHVLGTLSAVLSQMGMRDPTGFFAEFFSDASKTEIERHQRKLFVAQVLVPIALGILSEYESAGLYDAQRDPMAFDDFFAETGPPTAVLTGFLDDAVAMRRVEGFSIRDVMFDVSFERLSRTVKSVMGPKLGKLCEVIEQFDCDLLLLTGRPSRLPVVREMILNTLPIAPHRVIFMHEYQVGDWYPFSSRGELIGDPKTTVVVGALLCSLAEDLSIEGFSIAPNSFALPSTANFIGPMQRGDVIKDDDVIFTRGEDGKFGDPISAEMVFHGLVRIGYRQLKDESWPATPLYVLDFDKDADRQQHKHTMPWTVLFERDVPAEDDPRRKHRPRKTGKTDQDDESFRFAKKREYRSLKTDGTPAVTDALDLQLLTMADAGGYWLDTGKVTLMPDDQAGGK